MFNEKHLTKKNPRFYDFENIEKFASTLYALSIDEMCIFSIWLVWISNVQRKSPCEQIDRMVKLVIVRK